MANYLVDPKTGTVGEATKAAMNVGDKVYSGGGVYVKQADGSFAKEAGSKSTSNWNDVVNSYNAANNSGGSSGGGSSSYSGSTSGTKSSGGSTYVPGTPEVNNNNDHLYPTLESYSDPHTYTGTGNVSNKLQDTSVLMRRNVALAGQTVSVNGYNVTYDENGYATKAVKLRDAVTDPSGNVLRDAVTAARSISSAYGTDRSSYGGSDTDKYYFTDAELAEADYWRAQAAAGNISWAQANEMVNNTRAKYGYTADANGNPSIAAPTSYGTESENYAAEQKQMEYQRQLEAQREAEQQLVQQLLEQQRQAEQQLAQQKTQEGQGLAGFEQYLQEMGYTDYKDQVSAAIAAQVQAAVDAYNQQITKANQGYEDAARQAYVAKMLSQKNLDQMLSANGYAGGMADSQRIATEESYQNNLHDLTKQKEDTIKEIEAAITAARLSGDQQLAQLLASYLQNVQGDYSNYVNQQNSLAQQQEQTQRNSYAQLAMNALQLGQMPSADLLALAGIDAETAQSIINGVSGQAQGPTLSASQAYTAYNKGIQTPEVMEAMSYYYGVNAPQTTQQTTQKTGGTSYNNGGLSMADVKKVQAYYGLAQDGYWGPDSQSKTGFSSAAQAQAAMGNTSTGASFSDIKRTMQQFAAAGNESKIVSIANQYAGSMTDAQKQELQTMMRQYGYEISF